MSEKSGNKVDLWTGGDIAWYDFAIFEDFRRGVYKGCSQRVLSASKPLKHFLTSIIFVRGVISCIGLQRGTVLVVGPARRWVKNDMYERQNLD